jgi:hypothetical protein
VLKKFLRPIVIGIFRVWMSLSPPHKWSVAVCAVFKDEAEYLDEWLRFHSLMGVEHFFLYNDESSDDYFAVVEPWIQSGAVSLRSARGRRQPEVYNHCLWQGGRKAQWLAFIDIDEFLFSPSGSPLTEVLARFRDVPAVFVHWVLFGSSFHGKKTKESVIERFTRSQSIPSATYDGFDHRGGGDRSEYVSAWSRDGKSIINPRAVLEYSIHMPKLLAWGQTVNENGLPAQRRTPPGTSFSCDLLRINHYWSKSHEELQQKILRGAVSRENRQRNSVPRSFAREEQLNEVEDLTIHEVISQLRLRKQAVSSDLVHKENFS